MCISLATAATLAGAAGTLGSTAASIFGGDRNKAARGAVEQAQQRSMSDAIGQAAQNREAVRRASAGTRDSEGNTTSYNEAGNFWESTLGEGDQTVKRAADAASVRKNTVDAPMVTQANIQAGTNDAYKQRAANGAVNDLTTFRSPTEAEGIANAQQDTITANRETVRPILADAGRMFARQGTAAAPILSNVQRSAGENLRRGLERDREAGGSGVPTANARQSALVQRLAALTGRAPIEQTSIAPNTAPNMSPVLAQRAQGQADAVSRGASTTAYGTNANNESAKLAAIYGNGQASPASSIYAGSNALVTALEKLGTLFKKQGSPNDLQYDFSYGPQLPQ